MRYALLPCLFVVAVLSPLASSLGINCKGSRVCGNTPNVAQRLTHLIDNIDVNRQYQDREEIACVSNELDGKETSFCAFLRGTGGASGQKIQVLARALRDHGCYACGSVPISWPSNQNVKQGALVYDHVAKPCSPIDTLCTTYAAAGSQSARICTCTL